MSEYFQAVSALGRMLDQEAHLSDCLANTSPIAQQICYGTTRHWFYYDHVIDELLDKPLPEKHEDLWLLLMCGLYSIDHLKRPTHASVNHAVEAVKEFDKSWAKGLVNAILRRYGRETEQLAKKVLKHDDARLNHPDWLIQAIRQDWPDYPSIFDNNNAQPPMTLRVNLSRTTRPAYMAKLANEGIQSREGAFTQSALILDRPMAVELLPGWRSGEVSIQDEAPQLTPSLMNLSANLRVLDACAAPGGKTCHILEYQPDIDMTALDRDRKRIHLITENLERLSQSATVVASPFETYNAQSGYDRILVDAPCSATGIIRRHPDIKLLRSKSDVDKLPAIQRALLNKAFELLRTGGQLLYSTCSILRQENDQVVEQFLSEDPTRHLVTLSHSGSKAGSTLVATKYGLQFLPTAAEHDGFFYAAIRKADS